jgi:hypothetical protein
MLMHSDVIHGPNWPCGINGFRAWTDTKPVEGFMLCPCGWAGLKHYSQKEHVRAYLDDPDRYRLRVRYQERWRKGPRGGNLASGPHQWGKA